MKELYAANAMAQYDAASSQALEEFQSGRIGFPEWNRRQRECCEAYWSEVSREGHDDA